MGGSGSTSKEIKLTGHGNKTKSTLNTTSRFLDRLGMPFTENFRCCSVRPAGLCTERKERVQGRTRRIEEKWNRCKIVVWESGSIHSSSRH